MGIKVEIRMEAKCARGGVGPGLTYSSDRGQPDDRTLCEFIKSAKSCRDQCNKLRGDCPTGCQVNNLANSTAEEAKAVISGETGKRPKLLSG